MVRLEPLSGGAIKPHEQTFSAAKADRLELFKQARAHFSPIFSLYPDPENRVMGRCSRAPCRRPPWRPWKTSWATGSASTG